LPELRLALEKLMVEGLGAPVVLMLTLLTEKLTAGGTEMLTVSWAPAGTAVRASTVVTIPAIRTTGAAADARITGESPA
jgi:hypothetical protein